MALPRSKSQQLGSSRRAQRRRALTSTKIHGWFAALFSAYSGLIATRPQRALFFPPAQGEREKEGQRRSGGVVVQGEVCTRARGGAPPVSPIRHPPLPTRAKRGACDAAVWQTTWVVGTLPGFPGVSS